VEYVSTCTETPGYLEIHGFAPDASSKKEGDRLSILRALAVAEEIRRSSLPATNFTIVGRGSDLALARGDPASPQNRVAIIFPACR
jgi:outer membrane protein OmpA-like peptidoglycan-associated protein